MRNRLLPAWLPLLAATLLTSEALHILEAENTSVIVRDTDPSLMLTCSGSQEWDYCKWSFGNTSCARTSTSEDANCNMRLDETNYTRVEWIGAPVMDNKCSIAINKPTIADAGSWKCLLLKDASGSADSVATRGFSVTVYSRAKVLFVSRPFSAVTAGQSYSVECAAIGGVPAPTLMALVGPDERDPALDVKLETVEESRNIPGTVHGLFVYKPDTNYTKLFVKCMAFQADSNGYNVFEPVTVSQSFSVTFPPQPLPYPLPPFYVDPGFPAEIVITFEANPAPRHDQAVWHVVRQDSSDTMALPAGSSKDRFEARPLVVSGTRVTAVLVLLQVDFQDVLNYCYLEVANELGRIDYQFSLAPRPAPTTPPPISPSDDSGGDEMSVGTIVGIVVGVLLAVCAILIVVGFTYKQRLLCFAGRRNKEAAAFYMQVQRREEAASRSPQHSGAGASGGGFGVTGRGRHAKNNTYESRDEVDDREVLDQLDSRAGNIVRSGSGASASAQRAISYHMAVNNNKTREAETEALA